MKEEQKKTLEETVHRVFEESPIIKELTRLMCNFIDSIKFILNLSPLDNETKMMLVNSLADTIKQSFQKEINKTLEK